jgi:hypothetical protein
VCRLSAASGSSVDDSWCAPTEFCFTGARRGTCTGQAGGTARQLQSIALHAGQSSASHAVSHADVTSLCKRLSDAQATVAAGPSVLLVWLQTGVTKRQPGEPLLLAACSAAAWSPLGSSLALANASSSCRQEGTMRGCPLCHPCRCHVWQRRCHHTTCCCRTAHGCLRAAPAVACHPPPMQPLGAVAPRWQQPGCFFLPAAVAAAPPAELAGWRPLAAG